MILDPTLSTISKDVISKRGTFKDLRGEDAIQHEMGHFLALQDLWGSGAKGRIEFNFFWEKRKKMTQLQIIGGFTPDERPNKMDDAYSSAGPLYPSSVDLKFIHKTLLGRKKINSFFDNIGFNLYKLKDQGSTNFNPLKMKPLNAEEMLELLFFEWRKRRESVIDFKIWEKLLKN